MSGDIHDLVAYRMERAREALEEAQAMRDTGHANACMNRIYYACFYAASALLAAHGLSTRKHSGVRSLLNQRFVNTGLIARELGRFYNGLFESRQESDYADFVRVDPQTLPDMLDGATQFVNVIGSLVER